MMRYTVCVLTAAMLTSVGSLTADAAVSGPLAQYVSKEDASYQWQETRQGTFGKTTYTEIVLTSQTWKGIAWKHQLYVIKPSTVDSSARHAVLVIAGGRWRDEFGNASGDLKLPREAPIFSAVAEQLKAPVAVLLHVPFQPMFDGKVEDAIISLTFENFLRTGDAEWPLLLPMVKSAVRAMDTVQSFCKDQWSLDIDAFTITGASKRGWTTWLTGAVDSRAKAIAPMVIDTLNMQPQMKHQITAWGDYSNKIHDYTERGLQQHMATEKGRALRAIVDPYAYRQSLKQPKLIMIGTNDHYWPLDALNLYWDDLVGEKYILYVPNNRHGLRDFPRIVGSLSALYRHAAGGPKMPQLTWQFENDSQDLVLRVQSDPPPAKVQAWVADSDSRDFRQAVWQSRPMQADGTGHLFTLPLPKQGYAAVFGEAIYSSGDLPSYLSTNVRILNPEGMVAAEGLASRGDRSFSHESVASPQGRAGGS